MTTSPPERPAPPVLLVSATDSSGAAGMAVDVRVAELMGVPCRLAVTAVTVQGRGGVIAVAPQPAPLVASAIGAAFGDPPGLGSVKVGMLANAEVARAVAGGLAPVAAAGVPVVLDPVLRATSGGELLDPGGVEALLGFLLPLSALLTPNQGELESLATLAGWKGPREDQEGMARLLMGGGAGAVLVKGGEGEGAVATDTLFLPRETLRFEHPRFSGPVPRGTGCALSTAIAAGLAGGGSLAETVKRGIDLVEKLIAGSRLAEGNRLLFPGPG